MSDEDTLNNLRKKRDGGKGKKVLSWSFAIFIALIIVGVATNKGNNPSVSASNSTTGTTQTNSQAIAPVVTPATTDWIPKGFMQWSSDANIAYRWAPAGYTCNQYENSCYKAIFISQNGCPTEFYAAINLLDSGHTVITYSNGSLPSLQPLQKATIDFQDINGNSVFAQMSEITCQ